MMHEVRSIPPAPRRVRRGPLFAHRWPLLALGALLTVGGGLLAWLMFLQAGGKPALQARLDRGPNTTATGHVVALDAPFLVDGHRLQLVHYRFPSGDGERAGKSFALAGRYAEGDPAAVEIAADDATLHRIVGTQLHVARAWFTPEPYLGALVVPGALLLLGWLASAFRLRHVMVHGDVSVGTVTAIAPVRHVLPEMLRVRYEFRDRHAVLRRGQHWVRLHGELGARLLRQLHTGWFEPMPVLHDRQLPQWNRMLLPQDFLREPPPAPASRRAPA